MSIERYHKMIRENLIRGGDKGFSYQSETRKGLGKLQESLEEMVIEPKELGTKHDKGKPRWSLLPRGTLATVIAVLEYGAARYQVDNWKHVEDPERRYYDAAMRHIHAWWYGEQNDPESGQHHLAHAVACLLFLMWFDRQKEKKND